MRRRILDAVPGSARLYNLASLLLPMLLVGSALGWDPDVSFAQWDNFEWFLPGIWESQQRLLRGEFPHWNPFQNLGQELHAVGSLGVLYPGYTLAAMAVRALGLEPGALFSVVTVLHAGLAGFFIYLLATELGARPLFALVAALGLALSGHALYLTTVGIYVMPYLAWTAAALWSLKRLIDRPRSVSAFATATVSLALMLHLGLTDRAVYSWLAAGAFALGWAALRGCLVHRLPLLAGVALAAALLSMPTVLPTASLVGQTARTESLTREEFSFRGLAPGALIGMLLPVYRGADGYAERRINCTSYAGAWLVPALLLGSAALVRRRREERGALGASDALRTQAIVLLSVLGLLFLWLSLGSHGGLHPLTYDIPIWSRFRWPFKLYLRAMLLLGVAAALCLELLARRPFSVRRAACGIGLALLALLLWILRPAPLTASGGVVGIAGVASIALLGWLHVAAVRCALLGLAVAGSAAIPSLVSYPERFKTYGAERYGSHGPAQLGISLDYRVLPVSPPTATSPLQELGHYESATMNGYFSVTGTRSPLSMEALSEYLPAATHGVPTRSRLPELLESHLLRSLNTKYALVARYDDPMRRLLARLPGYEKVAETEQAEIHANRDALPRVYLAGAIEPAAAGIRRGLIENRAPLRTAFVEGLEPVAGLPNGTVEGWTWQPERIAVEVSVPDGGFLVVSSSFSRHWKVTIDGAPGRLWRTNGLISGVQLPPGASRIELDYDGRPFRLGLALAGAGLVLAAAVAATQRAGASRPTP